MTTAIMHLIKAPEELQVTTNSPLLLVLMNQDEMRGTLPTNKTQEEDLSHSKCNGKSASISSSRTSGRVDSDTIAKAK